MKQEWSKPVMCQLSAGMEISRYMPASVKNK